MIGRSWRVRLAYWLMRKERRRVEKQNHRILKQRKHFGERFPFDPIISRELDRAVAACELLGEPEESRT